MATYNQGAPVTTVQSATGASYTVAAGQYAVAKCYVNNGGSFTINGITVMGSASYSVLSSSPLTYADNLGGTGSNILNYQPGSALTPSGSAFASATASTQNTQEFVLKTGDVLLGSGTAHYHIEVYSA
jgi:hypothetical protein